MKKLRDNELAGGWQWYFFFFLERYFSIFLTEEKAMLASFVLSQCRGQDRLGSQI